MSIIPNLTNGNLSSQGTTHNIVTWNKTAEIIEKYLEKGSEVAIEGKLTSRSYDDKEGNKRYVTEIVVNELLLLGSK